MIQALVVDASVAFKLVIAEEYSGEAESLVYNSLQSGLAVVSPPHLYGEVTNALYQKLRRRNITEHEADQALERFLQLSIRVLEPEGLYQAAFAFAKANGIVSIYDSLYIVLSQMANAELWTDDRRLLNGLEGVAPWVRWIGEYSTGE